MRIKYLTISIFAFLFPILLSAESAESLTLVHYSLTGNACADVDPDSVVSMESLSKAEHDSIETQVLKNNEAAKKLQDELRVNAKKDSLNLSHLQRSTNIVTET